MPRHVPVSTYRLQLGPAFTFADAAATLDHLHRLGVTDLYLSPILTATPGSSHGYDVVDHTRIDPELGGRDGFERLAHAAHGLGMGVIVDVVPNHMAVPVPISLNVPLWDVLRHGPQSPYRHWFDIDLALEDRIVLPFLGRPLADVLEAGELSVHMRPARGAAAATAQLCYFDHRFPLRPGTEHLPLVDMLGRQHYRLAYWRSNEVNYRRFFDVDSLIALRMEDERVFTATHSLLIDLVHQGWIDGLRIDHPDGLADPAGYFERLAAATGGVWTVAEKILGSEELLPQQWRLDGTTGYDAAWRIGQVLTEPSGSAPLRELLHVSAPQELPEIRRTAKRDVLTSTLHAELARVLRLLHRVCADDLLLQDRAGPALRPALTELLIAADRYRAYAADAEDPHGVPASVPAIVQQWQQRARRHLDPRAHAALEMITALVSGRQVGTPELHGAAGREELQVRFHQLCGALMAKGIEDTTFYRWTHLTSLCEVGGAPERFAIEPTDLYSWAGHTQAHWPHTLTALSTHDAKRSEDVRARIAVLADYPQEWAAQVTALREATRGVRPPLDPVTENLFWQTLAGTWTQEGPPAGDRIEEYMIKAAREAGQWTTWTEQDDSGEARLREFTHAALASGPVAELMARWQHRTAAATRAMILGARALQLTLPGVADTYQGTEVTTTSLVDPDNRRPVDYSAIAAALAQLDAGRKPWDLASAKLDLTARLLRLRRRRPEPFVGREAGFVPLPTTNSCAVAFARLHAGKAQVVTVVTRRHRRLQESGGWQGATSHLPEGPWRNVLTGDHTPGGPVELASVLARAPVAVLERVS